jgi:hypothetical protein
MKIRALATHQKANFQWPALPGQFHPVLPVEKRQFGLYWNQF